MTRFRLAALAALSLPVLLLMSSGGEAQTEDVTYTAHSTCNTAQKTDRDFAKIRTEVRKRTKGGAHDKGPGRRGAAAATLPAGGVKVVTKLKDMTLSDGNDVVDAKDSDKTDADGLAKTKVEFDAFGNYRATSKVKVDGEVVAQDTVDFGVPDRESGKCDAPISGAG